MRTALSGQGTAIIACPKCANESSFLGPDTRISGGKVTLGRVQCLECNHASETAETFVKNVEIRYLVGL